MSTNTATTHGNLVASRTVRATFQVSGETQPRTMVCSLIDGYSTTADLPNIIAIALPGYRSAHEVTITAVETLATRLVSPLH